MIEPELETKLEEIRTLSEKAYRAAESTRKYFFWTGVVTIVLFVFPFIGLALMAPQFLSSYSTSLTGLGL